MKTTRILLGAIIILLGVVIYNQRKIEREQQTFVSPSNILHTSDDLEDSEDSYHTYPSSTYPKNEEPTEKIVVCQACFGQGYNAYEENGGVCSVCQGAKTMPESKMKKRYREWEKVEITCNLCGGTGLSYEARTKGLMNLDLIAPPGYYNCKVCNGKKKGTRAELMKNFGIAYEIYGPNL